MSALILIALFCLPTQAKKSNLLDEENLAPNNANRTTNTQLELPPIFASGAVLQRGVNLPIWGTALAGDSITVTFNGSIESAQADSSGNWRVDFQAMEAGGPYTMTVVSGVETVTLTDMYIGDVWFASGQSNMQWTISQLPIASDVINSANDLQIRQFRVSSTLSNEPSNTIPGNSSWAEATSSFVGNFSAVGYFFAKHLRTHVDVPVGIINATYGGSRIETWMSEDMLGFDEQDVTLADGASHRQPTLAYNSMIHPLLRFPVKGFLWYQGESNNSNSEDATAYGAQFKTMIQGWRSLWGQGDLPFLWVQLPNFSKLPGPNPSESHLWPQIRASQDSALVLPNTGQAITIDVGSSTNIHPPDKEPVGYRLSLIARKMVYGQDIIASGPIPKSNALQDSGRVHISYDHIGSGFIADPNGVPESFTIKGDDGTYVRAEALIQGDKIIVWNDAVPNPILVRYAWENNPINPNLYNSEGLPAAPFETTVNPALAVTNPGDQSNSVGDAISLPVIISNPANSPTTITATGLPGGLNINSDGLISGTLLAGGPDSNAVQVTVGDGINEISVEFTWTVLNPTPSDLVLDGDFEAGPVIAESPGWQTYSAGETVHNAWQVTDGSVDIHHYTMDGSGVGLQPQGGLQHMDLQGDNPGRVIQTLNGLTPGETYKLSFHYAAYPYAPIVGTAQARVTIAGLDHTWTATTSGADSWVKYSGTFIASSSSEELAFEGLGSARRWGGMLIDLVEVVSCVNGNCEIAVPDVTEFSPASGSVGETVTIKGTSFMNALTVSFNGVDAVIFTVVSDTVITATVPGGATTGSITVANASTSGSSTTDFDVITTGSTNLIIAGEFDGNPLATSGGWISYFEGETLYGVWQVVSGSVDIHHYQHANAGAPIYPAAGMHHLDLQGAGPGIIKQTVGGLTVGQKYRLSFLYAIYPYFAITEASANVQVGQTGNMLNESWTATNPGDISWENGEFVFEATATSADVQFSGFGSPRNWGGMLMDQIVLEACNDCSVGAGTEMQLTEAPELTLQRDVPEEFAIRDAFPNPFSTAADIVIGMPESEYVRMEVYNATGQLVNVLVDGEQPQGYRRVRWNGDDSSGAPVASGVYLIRYEAGGNVQTRKMVVIR